jgi:hypothetical protein
MNDLYLTDAKQVVEATSLIADFGEHAVVEAAIRAGRSATIGNHIAYCRWRQIERLIAMMGVTEATGTVH